MPTLFYARLIGLTAGTLVYLFLIALILGHRRPRRFERLLFLLILSLFFIYAGGLLEVNAEIQFGSVPEATRLVYASLIALGTLFLLPLVWHSHFEYAHSILNRRLDKVDRFLLCVMYFVPVTEIVFVTVIVWPASVGSLWRGFLEFQGEGLMGAWAICSVSAAVLPLLLLRLETRSNERHLGWGLSSAGIALSAILIARIAWATASPLAADILTTATIVAGILPGTLLIYFALKHNFLEYGAQRNMVYALSATLLALLYLSLVHRVSGWLAPVFPPEATASVLLFVLIFLFEPLERVIGPALHRTFRERIENWQRLAADLQEQARQGDVARLIAHAEKRIRDEFSLAAVRISVPRVPGGEALKSPGGLGHVVQVPLMKDRKVIGLLEAASTGSYLTGETSAALEYLAEQLPGMFDLCRLIEEKLGLERELAERERLAMLGQMAASVSHNLRNPLSSMKTVLQVQLEKPDLPADLRHDCELVLREIDRMSAKLRQLLDFAKPSPKGERVAVVALAKQAAALFRHDAERRNVRLEFDGPAEEVCARASEQALSEVLSNLILNAIEAHPNGARPGGGCVRVRLEREGDRVEIRVEDDGPGISPELRAKIFQPFFTTKATGTGLGLSIVARRVDEMGGTLSCESPLDGGIGTRFRVTLPIADEANGASI